tara:strand:+ start:75614 stop:76582 length:969 start_codon:yes stop_codon:yes gene_type:complete
LAIEFSIIVPVYNRPQEIDELLESLVNQSFQDSFEVIVVEDGSSVKADQIIAKYEQQLTLKYYDKENTGAGMSRNYGMERASGNYFIILDSDVIVPPDYLTNVHQCLSNQFTDAFGGPDAAHPNFTSMQKAINFSMTSFLTTGGIRGKRGGVGKFQLRSFNLGMSKDAFEATKGFSKMKTGEDIDFTFRLWEHGFKTQLIPEAFVYHKRRTNIKQFFHQTFAFGKARPILNKKYPGTGKLTFWFPSLFLIGIDLSIIAAFFGELHPLGIYFLYFILIFLSSAFYNGIRVGLLAILTTFTQFLGYGWGFLESYFELNFRKNSN